MPELGAHGLRNGLIAGALLIVAAPLIVGAGIAGVLSTVGASPGCGAVAEGASGAGALAAGVYAQPLHLQPGRWYELGATEYGGPGDPSSGDYGAIPDAAQAYLPSHPDSFAELSVLDENPARHGAFTFADANALDHLPYMSALRVLHDGREALLYKRDIGYGQGPGQVIANGQPYRIDVWWAAAHALAISKGAVQIELAPPTGAAATLGQLPSSGEAEPGRSEEGCATPAGANDAPLALVPGGATKILPSGLAAAGREAPLAVRRLVAAGNRLFGAGYLYGGGHGTSLDQLQSAYDCSSAVSYVLHAGGMLGPYALDSSQLAAYGLPGPGRYVSIYANAAHAFVYVGGLRLDTVEDPAFDTGPNSGKPGPRWRVYPSVPDWAAWTVRHPPGL